MKCSSNVIHLVLGASSSGKSHFIQNKIECGEWKGIPLYMASALKNGVTHTELTSESIVHYNMFRPYKNNSTNINNELLDDPVINELLKFRSRIKAYILVVPTTELLKRILLRKGIEDDLLGIKGSYPFSKLYELVCRLDMVFFYKKWISLLTDNQIDFVLFNSETSDYLSISIDDIANVICGNKDGRYSDNNAQYIVEANSIEY